MEYKVVCPHASISGGPEALHQLTRALVDIGRDAGIVYIPISPENRCAERFMHYAAPLFHELRDSGDQVVVLPETMTGMVWRFRHARCVIWWLSVDNYFKTLPSTRVKKFKSYCRAKLGRRRHYHFEPHPHLLHAHQSEYARRFLLRHGVTDSLPLTDYLAPGMVFDENRLTRTSRSDQCLYNPLKGREFTERLIAHCADLAVDFVALQGLSESQMRERLGRAKLYIDFGEHPGRDRIPREAALAGCVVITGCSGSAGNDVDVPLPALYKLDQSDAHALDRVRSLLQAVLGEHALHFSAQRPFRDSIAKQQTVFEHEVMAFSQRVEAAR
ncbi:MAG: hypothetical protein OEM00_08560 [Burkholderiaceae bacterium]|nr:hypothetical protein [Burkholderiaceae bacterium]MDH3461015.1 hypothetical protein [Burkholderiaceae bacterium]